jgi:hypothetical protein
MWGELVSTYSGNVMSAAQVSKYTDKSVKDYIFHLTSGPDVATIYFVCPRDYASTGYFMNHGIYKNVDVKASIVIATTGPMIIFQATGNIGYGQELIYNYNGNFDSYDTTAFE